MIKRRNLIILVTVGSFLFSSVTFYIYQIFRTPNILVEKPERYLYIPTGSDFKYVQTVMYDSDYVQDLLSFSFLAKILNYSDNVKPGRFLLRSDMPNLETIYLLRSGDQTPVNITFNNIRLKGELPGKICQSVEADNAVFKKLLYDSTVAASYGFDGETFLTMFLPNTYEVYWTINAQELMDRMHREYRQYWNETRLQKADDIGLNPVEVTILASIVNAETTKPEESTRIAGLYLNRLKRGIALQADPTLVFAAGDFTIKRVLNKHKEIDSPYNTYKYRGLPPGPINLPSITIIDAVLNFEKHKFLYMCAREDFSGYHDFATNLVDHLKNAERYQQALNRARLYK